MFFNLTAGTPVIIYGAGALGVNIYYKIRNLFPVEYFIDKKVKDIKNVSVPVCSINDVTGMTDSIVIVCVHNGIWHKEIAEELYKKGFSKILFLALSKEYNKEKSMMMNRAYNLFLEEQYDDLDNIPCYEEMKGKNSRKRIIRKNQEYIVTYCGREWIYTNNIIEAHQVNKIIDRESLYIGVPMSANELYMSLFRYFMYGEGSPDLYIKKMKQFNNSFDMSNEEFLQSQYYIYELLEREYEMGEEHIAYAPIDVRWNERGHFNIIDGHHRCAFYCLKGIRDVIVRMSMVDYITWMNKDKYEVVKRQIEQGEIIPALRINHPVLSQYDRKYEEYEITLLDKLQEWVYSSSKKYESVLEISPYQVYYGLSLYRMEKADKITGIVESEEVEFVRNLCELQYIPGESISIASSLEEVLRQENTYSLGLLLNIYDLEELKAKLPILEKRVTKTLFWQSKTDIEAEKNYIIQYSKFANYTHLAFKCVEGRLCEIGVFSINE